MFIFVIYRLIIMKYGVPTEQFVNDFSDIEFKYQWFDNAADAIAFARTVDMFWTDGDQSDEIITMGS